MTEAAAGSSGLTAAQAAERLRAEGFNELPHSGERSAFAIVVDVLREPMLMLLLVAGAVYLALGDIHEALILMAFACLSIIITVVQEARTERALEALRDLTSPRALVVRDGERQRIAAREVVRGDLVVLHEGDRVPADGWLMASDGLQVDESLLTGESIAVRKIAADPAAPPEAERPGGDDRPCVYSGTLVVRGSGLCIVSATGERSEIGRIGRVLATLEPEAPRLQKQTRQLVVRFAIFGAAASLLATVLHGLMRGNWLDAALAGIALGMSMLPEEFPVVLTIFMAMGAMRMSRERVLTRKAAAIETLGAATTLCTDKTGTLTQNRMRITELTLPDGRVLVPSGSADPALAGEFLELAELGMLASAVQPVDPMEVAFHELGEAQARRDPAWMLHHHYPLEPDLLAMSHVWGGGDQPGERMVATKGAPEAVAELCRMSAEERANLRTMVDAMAERGLRVLGVAEAHWPASPLPASHRAFAFTFRGLVGLADPLRPSVPEAVRLCRQAGIRVIMITGDYPQTARAIAAEAGIAHDDILTGEELAKLNDEELRQRIATAGVCARIMPEQKLRLVEALKADGQIVAMTGDGVNDAPSLKAAHIGVAMGGRGTDVAREASSLVLLDDDFGSIVKAIATGRRIYDNLRKAMAFIIAVHIPIAGIALLPLFTGMPLLLGPIHIAFIEMFIDPVCSLAFEAETDERNVMKRPPRAPEAPLFSRHLLGWSVLQGVIVFAAAACITVVLWTLGRSEGEVRAAAFGSLVLGITVLILVNRRFSASLSSALRRPNPALAAVLAGVAVVLAAASFVPAISGLFRFERVSGSDALVLAVAAVAILLLLERLKPRWAGKLLD